MIWNNSGNEPSLIAQSAKDEKIIFDKVLYNLIFDEK